MNVLAKVRRVLKKIVMRSRILEKIYIHYRTLQNRKIFKGLSENYFGEEPELITLFNQNKMYIYPSDQKGQQYKTYNTNDDIINQIWNKYVEQASVVFDLGANYGQFVLFLDAHKLMDGVRIYLF